jgi:hypothetical protein
MAGDSINDYLKYKNIEFAFPTPDEQLIQILENISIADPDALEV